jgi:hypothetical protein
MPAALAFPLQGRRYNWAYETDPSRTWTTAAWSAVAARAWAVRR